MPHWRLFYHLVWATRERYQMLTEPAAVQVLEQSVETTCRDLHVLVHAIGTMPDHVHLACSIPPSLSIAEVVKRLKGVSSHRLNQTVFATGEIGFAWQSEYGVYSFTERVLPEVVIYVRDQEARHAADDLWSGFEHTLFQGTTKEHARHGN